MLQVQHYRRVLAAACSSLQGYIDRLPQLYQHQLTQNNNIVPEVLAKPVPKKTKSKEVSYTKDPTLNKILNETAQTQEFEEYPSMGEYDTSNMADLLGYGGTPFGGGDDETKRKVSAAQTAKSAGIDPANPKVESVMNAMSRDYREVMKAIDKKQGR